MSWLGNYGTCVISRKGSLVDVSWMVFGYFYQFCIVNSATTSFVDYELKYSGEVYSRHFLLMQFMLMRLMFTHVTLI